MIETKISIGGHSITYKIQEKDTDELEFYRKNPRIATIVDSLEIVTEKAIDDALWQMPKTHDLKQSIELDGGLIHPIIVYENKVLEGNTRLCCYRHLFDNLKDSKWRKIQCQIITEPLTQEDIYRLLITEHIDGKIEWDAWEKAHFFSKIQEEGKSSEEIAKIAKESVSSINNKIKAYKLMIQSGVHDKSKYSYFEQIVISKPIREISKTEPKIETLVIKKIKDGTIRRAETIRRVGDIWKHKEARKKAFGSENKVLEDVHHELKAKAPMTDSPLMKDTEDLLTRVKALTREEREAIKNNLRDRSKIEYLTKELVQLCNEMNIKVHIPKKIAG